MKYYKSPLNFEQQAELLLKRGLVVIEKQDLVSFLSTVNYYRLSGYLYAFKSIDPVSEEECFVPGTSFDKIKQQYEFDRQLRFLLLDAIERIEIAVLRTQLVEAHTLAYGPFGYTVRNNYNPTFSICEFEKLMSEITQDEKRSYEEFINRYRSKYSEETCLPFWMAAEIMSFGQLFTLYRNSEKSFKKKISSAYGVYPPVFDSWLHTMNYIRNACAHHVRLWNRPLAVAPQFPDQKNDPIWYIPVKITNQRIFAVLTISQYLLKRMGLEREWKKSFYDLLLQNPQIPIKTMGFPKNWSESLIWK